MIVVLLCKRSYRPVGCRGEEPDCGRANWYVHMAVDSVTRIAVTLPVLRLAQLHVHRHWLSTLDLSLRMCLTHMEKLWTIDLQAPALRAWQKTKSCECSSCSGTSCRVRWRSCRKIE